MNISKRIIGVKILSVLLLLLFRNIAFSQDDDLCKTYPWACNLGLHLPGFPGSDGPGQLPEVTVTGYGGDSYWLFGFPVSNSLPPGWSVAAYQKMLNDNMKTEPCDGDVLRNPSLAPSSPGNYKGGTFGYTRTGADGNAKFHDGIDIAATPGTNLHTALSGEVTKVNSSFTQGQYLKNSYGNYVEIRSTYLGKKIYLKYNHMNGIANNLTVGSTVMAGDIIGMTGTTGNAAAPGVIPHVHIQAKDADYKKTDPSPYIRSKFDTSTGKTTNPCN